MKYNIRRVIVESVVDKYIKDIKSDTKRGVRNIIDFALMFSKGRFQKQFFNASQRLVENENSMYYTLGKRLIDSVSTEVIKGFGINMGLNAFTVGAKKIRECEQKERFNIPWCIGFHVDETVETEKIEEVVKEGTKFGVYAYIIFTKGGNIDIAGLTDMMNRNEECAFVVHVSPEAVKENIEIAVKCPNVMYSVYKSSESLSALGMLSQHRHICCVTVPYDDSNYKSVMDGTWDDGGYKEKCVMAIFVAEDSCSVENCEKVRDKIRIDRNSNEIPIFLMDYFSDCFLIDHIISEEDCYLGVMPDGTVTTSDELRELKTSLTIKGNSLYNVLKKHKPLEAGA